MKKIYIDPGHSKNDPGAVKYAVERDLNEKVKRYLINHRKEDLCGNFNYKRNYRSC